MESSRTEPIKRGRHEVGFTVVTESPADGGAGLAVPSSACCPISTLHSSRSKEAMPLAILRDDCKEENRSAGVGGNSDREPRDQTLLGGRVPRQTLLQIEGKPAARKPVRRASNGRFEAIK